jgi:hypothetical protein
MTQDLNKTNIDDAFARIFLGEAKVEDKEPQDKEVQASDHSVLSVQCNYVPTLHQVYHKH